MRYLEYIIYKKINYSNHKNTLIAYLQYIEKLFGNSV